MQNDSNTLRPQCLRSSQMQSRIRQILDSGKNFVTESAFEFGLRLITTNSCYLRRQDW